MFNFNLGYVSFFIDGYQFLTEPSLKNSRDLIVTAIGFKDPFASIFLSMCFSWSDTVDEMFNHKSNPYLIPNGGIMTW